jgi:hypothetical protein
LVHLLISVMAKKLDHTYEGMNREMSKAFKNKDYGMLENILGIKLCYDAHLIGKNTLANFRSLFTFTNCLIISLNSIN